jgi:cysteine desulfurase
MSRLIYLDNNATTCVAPEVREAMLPFLTDLWGNPSSMHAFGGSVMRHVEEAREKVAALIHADPSEIIFTSCGTESNNAAIYGVAEILGPQARLITSRVEHPAVLGPCRHFREHGHTVIELPVDGVGQVDLAALREALLGGHCLVSLMWANNETGTIFPIDEIATLVKSVGGVFHTDAVQAVGKVPLDVSRTPVDLLSLSGHKLHAPKGIGALYVRRGTRLKTFMIGGHQEHGRRGGTENVPYIVGLGKAAELAAASLAGESARVAPLRDRLEAGLLATCPDARVNGDPRHRLPNTLNISFEFIEGEAILYHLSDLGICASSGSACSSGSLEPSHVIRAMGVPFTAVHGSIRFSLSRYTTAADIDTVLDHVPRVVAKLRALSPFVTT